MEREQSVQNPCLHSGAQRLSKTVSLLVDSITVASMSLPCAGWFLLRPDHQASRGGGRGPSRSLRQL